MSQLLDAFGFLSVVLRGLTLSFQTLAIGGIVFDLLLPDERGTPEIRPACRRLAAWSAGILAATQAAYLATDTAILMNTTGLSFVQVAGANFFVAGSVTIFLAVGITALWTSSTRVARVTALAMSTGIIAASVMTSHAAARLEGRALLALLTGIHQSATACWIGGLPYLLLASSRGPSTPATLEVAARFSRVAQISVAGLLLGGAGLSIAYIGTPGALLGTAYGAMVTGKILMFGMLIVLGAFNFLIVRRIRAADPAPLFTLRRFAEVEVGIGFTVILAAASLTSQPPSADVRETSVPLQEIVRRFTPATPRLVPPSRDEFRSRASSATVRAALESFVPGQPVTPATPGEIALSEFNHNISGLFVLLAGALAVAARAGCRPARAWPFAFLGLAVFLFFLADADYWPVGPLSFWKGFTVAEVIQHRLVLPLIVAFAVFEWRVQAGRATTRHALVFPLVCAAGGALLLTHTHSLSNPKEELLAELSHIPIALLGVAAGWSRWLELRLANGPRRALSWIWPVCFMLIGAILLNYREH